jgi:hypothetical protein
MNRCTRFVAGFRVEAVQHCISGTRYTLMNPFVPIGCAMRNIKGQFVAEISDLRRYLLDS